MIRRIASGLVRRALVRITPMLAAPRVIFDRTGEAPYLSRWYLTARPTMPDGSEPFGRNGNPRHGIVWPRERAGLYLHRFHKGDDSTELHNHPWQWALSLVLAGGYREERRLGKFVVSRLVLPLSLNLIMADDFHRVDLLDDDAWSLFLVGPKLSSWSFWNRKTEETVPWREYIARVRGAGWQVAS